MMDPALSIEQAEDVIALEDSYSRLPAILELRPAMARRDWFALLGDNWSICDNIGRYLHVLKPLLHHASREDLDAMMSEAELEAWRSLPEDLTVHRGCYRNNQRGACWSLSREIAESFPRLLRYRGPGRALLLTGAASRARCVLKVDREESEVICVCVRVVATHRLPLFAARAA